ncbi:hypothetical protein DFH06DRAFT_314216 [Mycena polygramma]|nr:hypothetical protein DFH06DRAFT_314216 [Mycena polygramma]
MRSSPQAPDSPARHYGAAARFPIILNGHRRSFRIIPPHSRCGITGQQTCNPQTGQLFLRRSRVSTHSRSVNMTCHSWPHDISSSETTILSMAAHAICLVVHKLPKRSPQICRTAHLIAKSCLTTGRKDSWKSHSHTRRLSHRAQNPNGHCKSAPYPHRHHGSHVHLKWLQFRVPRLTPSSAAWIAPLNFSAPHAHDILRPYRHLRMPSNHFAVNTTYRLCCIFLVPSSALRPRRSATPPPPVLSTKTHRMPFESLAVTDSPCRTPPASRPTYVVAS